MALVLADRVRETTTTAGTGTITLLGAVPSCQSFAVVGDGNTTYYTIVAYSGTEWEVGIGTYTSSGTTLSRDTVLSSSNSGSLVDFSAGTKDVFVDYPAGRAVYEDAAGNVDGYPITGGTINNTVIGGTTPAAGTFTTLTATGQTNLGGTDTNPSFRVNAVSGANRYIDVAGSVVGTSLIRAWSVDGSASGMNFQTRGSTGFYFATNGSISNGQFNVTHTASAVNYVQVTGAATGGAVAVTAQGSDTNIGLELSAKGTSSINFRSGSSAVFQAIMNTGGDSWLAANRMTGNANLTASSASASNVSLSLQSKGTGAIDLAAGSKGVNISNGGTVTAVTRTVSGSGYTSLPTVAISAPTTAGGVQATASVGSMFTNTATVQSGGTGYTNGDVLTIVGGTAITSAATYTVTGVSGGAVTSVTPLNFNQYSVLPTNPVSTTGGTGSGATLNLTYGIGTVAFTITNAGSGYVEQPTVTFSGGGGSGAAAYATVGSGTIIRSLGATGAQSIDFQGASSINTSVPTFRIRDAGGNSFLMVGSATDTATLFAQGATNAVLTLASNGTQSVRIGTNGSSTVEQMRVAHTASAVNYVQVTGAATSGSPRIDFTGSDSGVGGAFVSKSVGAISFFNGGGITSRQFRIGANGITTAVNYINVDGSVAGSAPSFSCIGTDTNIDLALTPKGTGLVRFGTYTAGAPTATGYISIKAADGTTYKVLVGT